ncbi:MAG: RNA polymerase sigma factor [Bacteroidales bacterium]|nr:RNA polymerase sigma factor [Bacteroidales bacterium]
MAHENTAALSDEYLVEGCLKRDNACREALYRKYSGDLYQYALRYASCKEDAEDILQEAFLVIFERIGQFRNEGGLLSWMRTIVIRKAMRHYKRSLKRWRHEIPYQENITEYGADSETLPCHQIEYLSLLQLIQSLPDGLRMVFNLCEVEGYNCETAAEILDCSPSNCRSQLSRAKNRLRKLINGLDNI